MIAFPPSKEQIAAAVEAAQRTHDNFGYRRPLKDGYAERIVWAAICAMELKQQEPQHIDDDQQRR